MARWEANVAASWNYAILCLIHQMLSSKTRLRMTEVLIPCQTRSVVNGKVCWIAIKAKTRSTNLLEALELLSQFVIRLHINSLLVLILVSEGDEGVLCRFLIRFEHCSEGRNLPPANIRIIFDSWLPLMPAFPSTFMTCSVKHICNHIPSHAIVMAYPQFKSHEILRDWNYFFFLKNLSRPVYYNFHCHLLMINQWNIL